MEEFFSEPPCEPTRKVLALLGAIPCLLKPPYLPSLSIKKSSLVYSITIYMVVFYDVAVAIINAKRQYDQTDPTNPMRAQYLEHILATTPIVLGIFFWMDVPSVMCILHTFNDLQVKFWIATGKRLKNHRHEREKNILLSSFGMFFLLTLLLVFTLPDFGNDFALVISCWYGHILGICATILWTELSWRIYDAAADTKAELSGQLDVLSNTKVYHFRRVWLSMRAALDSMERLYSPSMLYAMSFLGVVIVLYEGAVLIQNGQTAAGVAHLLSGAYYVFIISIICRTSHWVQHEMKGMVGEVFPKLALTSYDIQVQREIVMIYFIESARPASTNLLGFIAVNKKLILTFFSNISTYIIVLVQFRQKGDDFCV